MVVTNAVDGDILTGGSYNFNLNYRLSQIMHDQSKYVWTGAGANACGTSGNGLTIVSYYVASGLIPINNYILFTGNVDVQAWGGSASCVAVAYVKIGPSGTTPSLTTIGSVDLASSNNTWASTTLMCAGSTTVDNVSVPAMVSVVLDKNCVPTCRSYMNSIFSVRY